MKKILYLFILVPILCGCATREYFARYRNYDIGRSVNEIRITPSQIIPYNQTQDKYIFEWDNGCKFAYYVNNKTKKVESWEYISSPDKCRLGVNWMGPW